MFLSGVIEGFYGRAWSFEQRIKMLDWIKDAGMNTFVYAPKDDIKLRARWRELYNYNELDKLTALVDQAAARGLEFMVALAPCLDITYSDPAELQAVLRRIDQLAGIGISNFALLFDDIPNALPERDTAMFASFADAQCHIANGVLAHLRSRGMQARVFFCPTEYCARFAGGDVTVSPYLKTLGTTLDPEIEVFWTGPEIVSEEITAESLKEIGAVLRRKPVIWENFHANDYDIRRIYVGPLGGRKSDILPLIAGFITNPNNEFEANFVPLRTTGRFLSTNAYDEAKAFTAALADWRPRFLLAYRNDAETLSTEEITLLAELFYQPFNCGPTIATLLDRTRALLAEHRPDVSTPEWKSGAAEVTALRDRIRLLFDRMTELENRDLFYAFQPYLWEAREDVTHLVTYLDWLATEPSTQESFPHEDRVYNFYRRGFTVSVQELFPRNRSGRFAHVP